MPRFFNFIIATATLACCMLAARGEAAFAASSAPPVACVTDDQCPDQTICTDGTCQTFERPTRVLLFRKEGPKTAFWLFTATPAKRDTSLRSRARAAAFAPAVAGAA